MKKVIISDLLISDLLITISIAAKCLDNDNNYHVISGVEIYRRFYSEEKERANGVLAIFLTKPISQLYDYLAAILEVSCFKSYNFQSYTNILLLVYYT